ncbi:MAG: hypothetical protein FWD26_00660 [Treponema sp.]|nr:hypothetical protein [Treponema sp.]
MKIGTKNIIIKNNINKVREDLSRMTRYHGSSSIISKHVHDVFWGKIIENNFKFYCKNSRLQTPKLYGKLIKILENETLIKINIKISYIEFILYIIWLIFAFFIFFYKILPEWFDNNIYLNIFFIFMLLIIPVIRFCFIYYNAKSMINNFYKYNNGLYQ